MPKVAFIGLGAMGSAMVKRLLAAGHPVTGYNRTRAKAEALASQGMTIADSARSAAEGADVVLSMVTDSEALRDVALSPDGILAGLGKGAVWAEMSTVSPAVTRMLGERVAARGAAILDAPVSGSTVTVAQGQLSFIVGGDPAALEQGRAVGVPLPATGLTHEMLTAARGLGLADRDFASVFDVLARMSGLPGS